MKRHRRLCTPEVARRALPKREIAAAGTLGKKCECREVDSRCCVLQDSCCRGLSRLSTYVLRWFVRTFKRRVLFNPPIIQPIKSMTPLKLNYVVPWKEREMRIRFAPHEVACTLIFLKIGAWRVSEIEIRNLETALVTRGLQSISLTENALVRLASSRYLLWKIYSLP